MLVLVVSFAGYLCMCCVCCSATLLLFVLGVDAEAEGRQRWRQGVDGSRELGAWSVERESESQP